MSRIRSSHPRIQHIVLVGASGSGKSTLAPVLAQRLELQVCDTDREIDARGPLRWGEVIRRFGIAHSRAIETKVVLAALNRPVQHVIAKGAGSWTIRSVRALARRKAVTVWLRAEVGTLIARVTGSDRYITRVRAPGLVIAEQLHEREELYAEADYVLSTDGLTVDAAADELIRRLNPG